MNFNGKVFRVDVPELLFVQVVQLVTGQMNPVALLVNERSVNSEQECALSV